MSLREWQSGGLESLSPFESGQWAGWEGPALIRPGHETRLALIGAVLALAGFCLPLVAVRYVGEAASIAFTGPALLAVDPLLWLVPALGGLALLVAMRDPERRGRALLGSLALGALVPLVAGLVPGFSNQTRSGISERGFYGTLAELRRRRDAAHARAVETWEKSQKKADKQGLEEIDAGELGELDDGPPKPKKQAPQAPARPAEPRLEQQAPAPGFYLLLLGLALCFTASWPWTEAALAWIERVLLVLLLLAMLVLAGLPVLVDLDRSKRLADRVGSTAWMVRLSQMSVIWVGLIGASLATRERGHIAIEVLDRFAPKSVCAWLKVAGAVFAVVVLILLCAAGGEYVLDVRAALLTKQLDNPTPAPPYVEIPRWRVALHQWVFTLVFPVGLFALALRFALLGGQDLLGVKFDHFYGAPR